MAFTVAVNEKSVFGNMRVHLISCSCDGAEASIDTGLTRVFSYSIGHQSLTTGSPKIYANKGTTGTAANGYLGISGVANGDVFFINVFGV